MGLSNYDPPAYKNLLIWLFGEVIVGIFLCSIPLHAGFCASNQSSGVDLASSALCSEGNLKRVILPP